MPDSRNNGRAAGGAILTQDEAQAIVEKAVKWSKADAVDVQVNTYTQGNIRFADNQVSVTSSARPSAGPRSAAGWPGRSST